VQMLEVALSRRMCCSRVCSRKCPPSYVKLAEILCKLRSRTCIAMRYAGFPEASMDIPMIRPGILRAR
jgi:hypothetical protein